MLDSLARGGDHKPGACRFSASAETHQRARGGRMAKSWLAGLVERIAKPGLSTAGARKGARGFESHPAAVRSRRCLPQPRQEPLDSVGLATMEMPGGLSLVSVSALGRPGARDNEPQRGCRPATLWSCGDSVSCGAFGTPAHSQQWPWAGLLLLLSPGVAMSHSPELPPGPSEDAQTDRHLAMRSVSARLRRS